MDDPNQSPVLSSPLSDSGQSVVGESDKPITDNGRQSLPVRRILVVGIVILIIMNLGVLYQHAAISPENLTSIKSEKSQEEVIIGIVDSLSGFKDKEVLAHLNLATSLDDPKKAYEEYKLAYTALGLRFNETNDNRYKQIMDEVKLRMQSFTMYEESDVKAPKKRGIKKVALVEPESGKEFPVPSTGYLELGIEKGNKAQTYLVRLEYTDGKKEESFVTFESQ